MSCNCGKQTSQSKCGCSSNQCITGSNWLIPVTTVPPIELASRRNAYILPNDSVYILNYSGNEMVPIGSGNSCTIQWENDALPPIDEANPCVIYIQDNIPYILSEDKSVFQKLFKDNTDIHQIRTTLGVPGITDSDIFNADVISKADLLWTKHVLPEGNLVSINGEFIVKEAQSTSYNKIFWETPNGFEIMDTSIIVGQFVEIMQYVPLVNASLNSLIDINGVLGWSNYSSIPIGNYTINKQLRAE